MAQKQKGHPNDVRGAFGNDFLLFRLAGDPNMDRYDKNPCLLVRDVEFESVRMQDEPGLFLGLVVPVARDVVQRQKLVVPVPFEVSFFISILDGDPPSLLCFTPCPTYAIVPTRTPKAARLQPEPSVS
ncbi:MAG: hypothetical protein JST12_14355 [Armatimonadetes bacterium]|nr:hypothetical protein [Armatimonadota bacterium]